MTKRLLISAVAVLFMASVGLAQEKPAAKKKAAAAAKEGSYVGWVTDDHCGAKGAKAGHEECLKKCIGMGSKYALYVPKTKKVYILDPQDKVAEHGDHHVKVTGTVEGETLHVASISMVPEKKPAAKKAAPKAS